MVYNKEIYGSDYFHEEEDWEGFKPILFSLKHVLDLPNNYSMVDIGSSRGSFVKSAREIGVDAHGYDFSEWCVSNAFDSIKEYIHLQDILNLTYHNLYDLVISLNTIEHFYKEDIDTVLNNILSISKKWTFLLIDNTSKESKGEYRDARFAPSKYDDLDNKKLNDFEKSCIKSGHYYFVPQLEWDERISKFNTEFNIRGDLVDEWRRHVPGFFLNDWSVIYIIEKRDD